MKQSLIKGFKNFFNAKPKANSAILTSTEQTTNKVISFGQEKMEDEEINYDETSDVRYDKIQQYPSLKEFGLKKDQIEAGEIPILHQTKLVYCKLSEDDKYEECEFIITNYKICIKVIKGDFIFYPLGKIDKLQKYIANESVFKILVKFKDGRKIKLRISTETSWKKIYERLQKFAFVTSKIHFFAFRHYENNKQFEENHKGWKLFDFLQQFKRMGILPMQHTEDNITEYTSDFKILDNKEGKVCTTYPSTFIVPSRMPYDCLLRCAKFRSRERMPALTYAYEYSKGKYSCIFRSSQCRSGVQNNRSFDDELMLRVIGNLKFDPQTNSNSELIRCKIYDARGYIAAMGNRLQGKGFQSVENYQNCDLEFLNIPNIHAVRQSYTKLIEGSYGDDSKFYNVLAESKWYEYIFLILSGALDLAHNLKKGINNLVHCSDGWDRTSQLCALAAMMIDPFYRTIKGFQVLVEKDWIYFGHQFAKRLGQGMNNPGNEDKSQIFLQFLDCVTQLMYQFPSEFQFNYGYICEIGEQAYNHLYGNFLCNCYLEMARYSIFSRTVSLWSKISRNEEMYLNPFYSPSKDDLLAFEPEVKNMRLWKEHFLQYIPLLRDVYDIYSCKFTEDNLEIMHRHIIKQNQLLTEKHEQNDQCIASLNEELQQLQKEWETNKMLIDRAINQKKAEDKPNNIYKKQIVKDKKEQAEDEKEKTQYKEEKIEKKEEKIEKKEKIGEQEKKQEAQENRRRDQEVKVDDKTDKEEKVDKEEEKMDIKEKVDKEEIQVKKEIQVEKKIEDKEEIEDKRQVEDKRQIEEIEDKERPAETQRVQIEEMNQQQ